MLGGLLSEQLGQGVSNVERETDVICRWGSNKWQRTRNTLCGRVTTCSCKWRGLTRDWSSLVEGDEGWIGPSGKLLCLRQNQKIMQHMHGNIPYLFDSGPIR